MQTLSDNKLDTKGPILLFDGLCNLCDASVLWTIDRDPQAQIRFAALQSGRGEKLLATFGRVAPSDGADPFSVMLIADGKLYERSSAALRAAGYLRGAWPALKVFLLVPRPLRNGVYNFIAKHRFRWFGRRDACRIPTPELRSRFLDD